MDLYLHSIIHISCILDYVTRVQKEFLLYAITFFFKIVLRWRIVFLTFCTPQVARDEG
jgi:hypothetical protein